MPPTTRSTTRSAGAGPKTTAKPATNTKSKVAAKPKGIRKLARKPRKKVTKTDFQDVAGSSSNYTYFELQPPTKNEAEQNNGFVNRHIKKAKKKYNGSEVKISETAYERLIKMYIEVEKRTPESNGIVHIFEDYRGLGTMEVIENQIADYVKDLKHANPDVLKLFQITETLVFFLDGAWDIVWFNVDNAEGIEALVGLVGALFVDCFRRLNADQTLSLMAPPERSSLENLGLVMGLAVGFGESWDSILGETTTWWQEEIVGMAKAKGVVLRNTKGLFKEEDMKEGERKLGEESDMTFTARVEAYKKKAEKLGGIYYDLTR